MFNKWIVPRNIRKRLNNCNYEMARSHLIDQWQGKVTPKELAGILDRFINNPCKETALELIKYDANFIALFELCRMGGFTECLFREERNKSNS